MDLLARSSALILLIATAAFAQNSAPVIDTPPANGAPKTFPVGKTLIFPITATDADGDPLTFKVTSDNPKMIARVKTGNPVLKLNVSYLGGQTGQMVFQLFREWTPVTAGFIGGFAQADFYDNLTFHRVINGFMIQGGDPLGSGQGGPGMTGGNPGSAFKFDSEFQPGLIFTGRGQLAMANAGYNNNDYTGTNGSQFFITLVQPRYLDFKHTIFGQMLRGWNVLDAIANVAVDGNDKPLQNVTITSATVEPDDHDAVLMLSAIGSVPAPGAKITVTAEDGKGGVTKKEIFFTTMAKDTTNSPPVVGSVPHQTVQKETQLNFPLKNFDLEWDYTVLNHGLLGTGGVNALSSQSGLNAAVLGKDNFEGQVRMGFEIGQFDIVVGQTSTATVQSYATVTIGDRAVRPMPVTIKAAPNVAFNGVVARFKDLDPGATAADYSGNVKINWGDGTPVENGTIAADSAVPGLANLAVSGAHTFSDPGFYTITVTVLGSKGSLGVIRSTAIVSANSIVAVGENFDVKGPLAANRILATFTDSTSPGRPADYTATVDWGDGVVTKGVIAKRADRSFIVRGTHAYKDAEPFAICVRIHQKGADPATDAFAWSLANVGGFKPAQQHLPPFPAVHLVGAWNSGPGKQVVSQIVGNTLNPASLSEILRGAFVVVNSGGKTSPPAKIRYSLSRPPVRITGFTVGAPTTVTTATAHGFATDDEVLIEGVAGGGFGGTINGTHTVTVVNATQFRIQIQCTNSSVTQPGTAFSRANPLTGNTPLTVNGLPDITVVPFAPNDGGQGQFTISLPTGQSGTGRYLLSELVYSDPIIDFNRSPKVVIAGPIDPAVIVYDVQSELGRLPSGEFLTDENGKKVTVKVVLDTAPTSNVTIPVESSVGTEGTVSPSSLTFTSANWNTAQTVTVTGANDGTIKDGNKAYKVTLKTPNTTDANYVGIAPLEISLINLDND